MDVPLWYFMSHFVCLNPEKTVTYGKILFWKNEISKETDLNRALASQLLGGLLSPSDMHMEKKLSHRILLHFPFDMSTYTVDGQYCYNLVLLTMMVTSSSFKPYRAKYQGVFLDLVVSAKLRQPTEQRQENFSFACSHLKF